MSYLTLHFRTSTDQHYKDKLEEFLTHVLFSCNSVFNMWADLDLSPPLAKSIECLQDQPPKACTGWVSLLGCPTGYSWSLLSTPSPVMLQTSGRKERESPLAEHIFPRASQAHCISRKSFPSPVIQPQLHPTAHPRSLLQCASSTW